MFYLHKILPVFLSPIFVVFFLVILGALTKNKKISYLAAALLYLLSMPFVANEVFRYVEGYAVKRPISEVSDAKAIMVLGGMLTSAPTPDGSGPEWVDPDRFFAGIELFKAGKAPEIVFVRSFSPLNGGQEVEGEYQRQMAISMGIPEASIKLTQRAVNTEEEAEGLRKLPMPEGSKIILVTSAFHMKRSVHLFEKAGFDVQPYPVDFKEDLIKQNTLLEFLPDPDALKNSSIAIRELIGRSYYQLLGKITSSSFKSESMHL